MKLLSIALASALLQGSWAPVAQEVKNLDSKPQDSVEKSGKVSLDKALELILPASGSQPSAKPENSPGTISPESVEIIPPKVFDQPELDWKEGIQMDPGLEDHSEIEHPFLIEGV